MSKGKIVLHNNLQMKSIQKTFSVALSRDMVPEAKIIVYVMLQDSEVLADSLQFHVDGLHANKVRLGLLIPNLSSMCPEFNVNTAIR